jgi:dCTP deaminase
VILSDREARALIQRKIIWVTPCPPPGEKRWSATSLDLTLDAEIRPWEARADADVIIAPSSPDFNSNELIRQLTQPQTCAGEGYLMQPRTFVLGWTAEKIKLPNASRIAARVEGKSSLARIGLGIHVTAPTIHPGFGEKVDEPDFPGSQIRLEIWNISPLKIRLKQGMPICQILFDEVHGIPEGRYAGQFAIQGPT